MVTKSEMLKILEATDFPINKGRINVLKKGQTHSQSMVLGKVRKLCSSCDGKVCKVLSRHNEKHKALLKAAKSFLKTHDLNYKFEAVTINKNHAAAKHTDKTTKGTATSSGSATTPELVFNDKKSPHHGAHNIKNKWLKFVGDTEHYVKPFKGTRYTLVYYHWT